MAGTVALPAPGLSASDLMMANVQAGKKPNAAAQSKARGAAQDFEAVFLNSMFQQMFTGTDGEGPMSGSGASGVWRSMMVDEISKKVARAGGVGLSNQIYKSLLALQEVRQ